MYVQFCICVVLCVCSFVNMQFYVGTVLYMCSFCVYIYNFVYLQFCVYAVFLCMCSFVLYMCMSLESRDNAFPGVGVISPAESPRMSASNQIQVLCKNRSCS